ncbi:MAG: hypothetical protein ABI635_11690 [Actinomycetota bacterium]
MKNVTVTLDEKTALWASLEAARRDISVSSLIRQLLADHKDNLAGFEVAKVRYLSRQPSAMSKKGSRYPRRGELHDRAGPR